MQRTSFLLTILLILLSLSALSVSAETEEIAAWVDGMPIPAAAVTARARSGTAMNSQMSDEEREAAYQQAWRAALLNLIAEQACVNESVRLGLDRDPAVQEAADLRYQKMIEAVESYVRASYPNLDQEAMDEEVDAMLKVMGQTRESYREAAFRSAQIAALEQHWLESYPEPTAAEIRAWYDGLYTAQQALFDADENAFESAMLNHETVVYRPVDLKLIRKAEFLFSDDTYSYIRQLRQYGFSNTDPLIEEQYHALADEVEDVYEALLSGETTFDEVLESLEPGSSSKVNYFHPSSTRFNQEYYDRANAFTTPGEISTAYILHNGYAVLEYYGDLPAGVVPLEEAEDAIIAEITAAGSREYLTARRQELLDNAEIVFPSEGE